MANTAAKKQAASNIQALKQLHLAFLAVNALFLVSHFVLSRPRSIKPYLLFSMPSFFLQWQLERMGRPKYDSKGALVNPGDDLSQAGLTEWFHDVIYLTWGCDLLVAITGSNKCWWLIAAIPVYATYMIYTKFIKKNKPINPEGEIADQQRSKRQEKLERKNKRIRYVQG